ncbi:hypothetical protein FRB95_009969 [Tulasnella sp. JGI-2019a]|nr:hypothetical protein FRB95_009969 [Tulasnella sp. JGI-2019a]
MPTLDQDYLALRTALEKLGTYRIEYSQLRIDMDNELGRGGFGIVRRAYLGGLMVAAKILRSDESKDIRVAKRLVREMKIWSGLRHPNVLPLIGFYLSQTLDLAIIVCPIAPYGSLRDYALREKPSDACRLRLAHDTLSGLIYLHSLNPPVIHGDIKAANALVYEGPRAVLSDFGLAMAASEAPSGLTTSHGLLGALRWWGPELFDGKPRCTASDIWAWACLLVEIMKERVPYSWIEQDILIVKAAFNGMLPEPKDGLENPLDLWSVIRMCWEVNQEKRATGIMVVKALETLIRIVESINNPEGIAPVHRAALVTFPRYIAHHSSVPFDVASRLYARFQKDGNPTDLDKAIECGGEALRLRPPGHPDRSQTVHNMAVYLDSRFKKDRNRTDLEKAIACSREALRLRPPGHPHRSSSVQNMAAYLNTRFLKDGNHGDLDMAIGYQQEAIQLRPPDHPDRSQTVHNMAMYLNIRFKTDKNRTDLDAAITYQQEAVTLRPPGHPDRSNSVYDMAVYIYTRFQQDGNRADLEKAIAYEEEAFQLRPP